jgi:hypothetical protein
MVMCGGGFGEDQEEECFGEEDDQVLSDLYSERGRR